MSFLGSVIIFLDSKVAFFEVVDGNFADTSVELVNKSLGNLASGEAGVIFGADAGFDKPSGGTSWVISVMS